MHTSYSLLLCVMCVIFCCNEAQQNLRATPSIILLTVPGSTYVVVHYCYLFLLSVFML